MYPFHARTARPISTKFCTDLPTNSGKVLNTSMTTPTQPVDPSVPQTLKPKWVTGEKTLCNIKCPDGWPKLIEFFPGSAGARLASVKIKLVEYSHRVSKLVKVSYQDENRRKFICKGIIFVFCIEVMLDLKFLPNRGFKPTRMVSGSPVMIPFRFSWSIL